VLNVSTVLYFSKKKKAAVVMVSHLLSYRHVKFQNPQADTYSDRNHQIKRNHIPVPQARFPRLFFPTPRTWPAPS
jgi:hypothetical protein